MPWVLARTGVPVLWQFRNKPLANSNSQMCRPIPQQHNNGLKTHIASLKEKSKRMYISRLILKRAFCQGMVYPLAPKSPRNQITLRLPYHSSSYHRKFSKLLVQQEADHDCSEILQVFLVGRSNLVFSGWRPTPSLLS